MFFLLTSLFFLTFSSAINNGNVDVRQIYHVPVEAVLKTHCMFWVCELGDGLPLLRQHIKPLNRANGVEQVQELFIGCGG